MKLWMAMFNLNTGCNVHQYELLICAPDYTSAKNQVYAFDNKYCDCEDNIDYSTLAIVALDTSKAKTLRTFDRGVI